MVPIFIIIIIIIIIIIKRFIWRHTHRPTYV
jgi:hypothetical protein